MRRTDLPYFRLDPSTNTFAVLSARTEFSLVPAKQKTHPLSIVTCVNGHASKYPPQRKVFLIGNQKKTGGGGLENTQRIIRQATLKYMRMGQRGNSSTTTRELLRELHGKWISRNAWALITAGNSAKANSSAGPGIVGTTSKPSQDSCAKTRK
ncbi:hypothetical protein TcG_09595 [Trypanosoma cruzi]|nr:hypothetical protein TcG_09595 [Trypanosoma cruzi]